ncbi:MAG: hypothetical protein BVN35_20325 [Proteobacteria bacterium ST_bin11]|nr:MAG: hypothetical protein BVN35_20325 [Proteobacteria bacterium ST_bin11]
MSAKELLPGLELYNRVRAGFILQNSSLGEWCRNNGIQQTSAKACLHGTWGGPKGMAMRDRLIKDSNIEHLSLKAA